MQPKLREYRPETDFVRVRDLLVVTRPYFITTGNWDLVRWNYARHYVVPRLGTYKVPEPSTEAGLQAIRFWESTIGVWETATGEIVGVVHSEAPRYGDAYVQRHPQWASLLEEMLEYAEATLVDPESNALKIYVQDHDHQLQRIAQGRGYQKDVEDPGYDSEFVIDRLPPCGLPAGFAVRSMADGGRGELWRAAVGRGFDHLDPGEWPSPFAYQELQKAPDYRPDLDLHVVSPEGRYVSCCIVWYDAHNRTGCFEPVGTDPEYRRRGLGREVVMEGLRRIAGLGAETATVGSGLPFYQAIGFRIKYVGHYWIKNG